MSSIGKLRIKKGDKVVVIAGKDKGKTGHVLSVISEKLKIVVSGVNLIKKHEKPNPKNEKGGIIEKEAPIGYSNVMMYSSKLDRGFRIAIKERNAKKVVRFCRQTEEEF